MEDELFEFKNTKLAKFLMWARGVFMIATPLSILTAAFILGGFYKESKLLMWDSVQQKSGYLNRIDRLPTDIEIEHLRDHVTSKNVHMSREAKDSIYVPRTEYEELIKNNAIDTYNMKQKIDRVLDSQRSMENTLRAMNYKLDSKK